VARREWEQAARFGAAAVEPLVATLQHGDPDWRVAAGAAAALGQLGDARAVEPLVAALQHPHVNVEQAVVAALEQLGDPRAVEPLVAALQDRGVPIRQAAAGALGQLGDARAVEPLVLALQDADEGVRQAAAGALGQLGDARAVEPLVVAAARGSRAAAEALRRLGPAAVEPLLERLKDQNRDNDARQHAAAALGQIGDARAVEPLVAALEDADPDVRWAVAKALETLGWQPVDKTHRARHAVALRDWATAVALGAAAVAPLVTALQGGWHRDVVMAAAHALGTIGDGRAVEPLVEWLQAWGTDKRVAAAEALGQLGDARAVEPLLVVVKAEDGATHKNSPSRVAATAMRALQQVLERSAARVAPQALHDLSRLTNLVQIVYQYDSCDNKTGEDRREVDCTRVRQLARQELSRRQHAQPWRP